MPEGLTENEGRKTDQDLLSRITIMPEGPNSRSRVKREPKHKINRKLCPQGLTGNFER